MRERQRERILQEIREASFALLSERGDEVSVSDIVKRAGVSERTFYRYFPTREDALLGWIDESAQVVHARLRDHPHGHTVGAVLEEALAAANVATMQSPASWNALRVVFSSPKLFSAYAERQRRWESEVAIVIAERLGTSVESDSRPGVWSAMAFAIATKVSYDYVMAGKRRGFEAKLREAFAHAAEFLTHPLP